MNFRSLRLRYEGLGGNDFYVGKRTVLGEIYGEVRFPCPWWAI